MKFKFLLIPVLAFIFCMPMNAQKVAVKTNLISDVLLSPNLGFEAGLARKWTLDVNGQLNLWTVDDKKWRHYFVQPELRYWLCRSFQGHFFGVHGIGGQYNFGNIDFNLNFLDTDRHPHKGMRYEGWGAGAGLSYGYAWAVHPRWNIEAEIGLGWIYTRYSSYPCAKCGKRISNNRPHNYVGPTKAAINVVYIIK
ncbi:MAG: DUF3575 domain-containing protein [Muribaculaceae bacterium]|nr:DUF3575 domain-containing protein [Muribaculaceae bacterium]